ncbi:hypothetical protein [Pandoraea capi]|nr:hypothetical protein [Pandoraea capi]
MNKEKRQPCSAFRLGEGLCKFGFPQTGKGSSICRGEPCMTCGKWTDDAPMCQRDDNLPPHLFDENGLAKHTEYRRAELVAASQAAQER